MGSIKDFGQLDFEKLKSFTEKGFYPKTIFDIGASNGSWTNTMLSLFPQTEFHLFEPLADIEADYGAKLKSTLQKNPNTRLHKYVVGKETGVTEFYRSKKNH